MLKIRIDELDHLIQGKLCLHISMQGFKKNFKEVSRGEKRRQNDGRIR